MNKIQYGKIGQFQNLFFFRVSCLYIIWMKDLSHIIPTLCDD